MTPPDSSGTHTAAPSPKNASPGAPALVYRSLCHLLRTSALLFCVLTLIACGDPSFPNLPEGSFLGKVSVQEGKEKSRDFEFFVQRLKDEDEFLLVPFDSAWPTQLISLKPLDGDSKKEVFSPVSISANAKELLLVGKKEKDVLKGEILHKEEEKGEWSISLRPERTERYDLISEYPQLSMPEILASKAQLQSILTQQEDVRRAIAEAEQRKTLLKKYVADGRELRKRANSRRDELQKKVAELKNTRKGKLKQLRRHVRELEQLMRITNRGRAVDLARRVAKREDKWYLVNWQAGSDTGAVEEAIAEQMGVNLRKLQKSYRKAKEYEDLKMVISEEKRKIRELTREYQRRLDPPKKKEEPEEKEKKKSPWWRRLDTVFG